MTRLEEDRNELMNILTIAKENGLRAFITSGYNYCYGYIITKNENVLSIDKNYFGGWNFSFAYPPSRKNGSGCSCNEQPIYDIDMETIEKMEFEGITFATKLKAKRYKNSKQFFSQLWNRNELQEV